MLQLRRHTQRLYAKICTVGGQQVGWEGGRRGGRCAAGGLHIGRHGAEVCLREGPQQDQVVAVGDPAEHDEEHVRLEGVVS